jgi:hypothetical protein
MKKTKKKKEEKMEMGFDFCRIPRLAASNLKREN